MNGFWKNKKVLITGDTGFKGSWLICLLMKLESKVYGISLKLNKTNKLYKKLISEDKFVDSQKNNYQHFDLDIRDKQNLRKLIKEIKPEIVFHLAAQPLVRESYKLPILTWEVNVMGTINLLDALRDLNYCSVVVITTDKVYENLSWSYSYRESDLLGGYDPYSSSKAAVELAVKTWRKSFYKNQIRISTARAGNVIGGGDWALERIVPDTIESLINQKPLLLRYPDAIRPWQHVLDPLFGYILLAEKQISSQKSFEYNFGPVESENITVADLVKKIIDEWGSRLEINKLENQPIETNYLKLATDKARNELNWQPKWSFNQSISKTVNWYKNVHLGKSAFESIINDIDSYITSNN